MEMWSLLFWFHKKRLMQNGCWIFRRCHMRNVMRCLDKHKSASVSHNQFRSMQIREEGHLVMSKMVIFSRQRTLSTSLCCGQLVLRHCMCWREGDSIFKQPINWERQLGGIWAFLFKLLALNTQNKALRPQVKSEAIKLMTCLKQVKREQVWWSILTYATFIRNDKIIFYPTLLNHSVNINLACVCSKGKAH